MSEGENPRRLPDEQVHLEPARRYDRAKLSIFLSHITIESKLADFLQESILRDFLGLASVFSSSDRTSIPVGSGWLEAVTRAIAGADLHMIVCSPDSVERPWIHFESGAAHLRGIPIVPFCHSGLSPAQLPVPLSIYEGIVASSPEGLEELYSAIATLLGSNLPRVDFRKYAAQVLELEDEYRTQRQQVEGMPSIAASIEVIRDPKALCISSKQFRAIGFENQLKKVIDAFPSEVEHNQVFSRSELVETLTSNKFDIVHIAAFACPRTGDIIFSDVDLQTGLCPLSEPEGRITAEALAKLLRTSETRLAVVTSCQSLALTTVLQDSCHVIAAQDMVSSKTMAAWVDAFYGVLTRKPLSEALDFSRLSSGAPMRLYTRRVQSVELVVEKSKHPEIL